MGLYIKEMYWWNKFKKCTEGTKIVIEGKEYFIPQDEKGLEFYMYLINKYKYKLNDRRTITRTNKREKRECKI